MPWALWYRRGRKNSPQGTQRTRSHSRRWTRSPLRMALVLRHPWGSKSRAGTPLAREHPLGKRCPAGRAQPWPTMNPRRRSSQLRKGPCSFLFGGRRLHRTCPRGRASPSRTQQGSTSPPGTAPVTRCRRAMGRNSPPGTGLPSPSPSPPRGSSRARTASAQARRPCTKSRKSNIDTRSSLR
jgi:hypothetical protein